MKFGQTLRQRSSPQWSHYNIDYDDLKYLIKDRTTDRRARPTSIPGASNGDDRWSSLEDELLAHIQQQQERVSLFTKSKFGELERRVDFLERQLKILVRRCERGDVQIRRSRRFHDLVVSADSIGNEIQSLSRYLNTQKIGFRKILKKYRKWTGSTRLGLRVNNEIFNQQSSFLQPDLATLLDRLTEVQLSLHRLVDRTTPSSAGAPVSVDRRPSAHTEAPGSVAARLNKAYKDNSALGIDSALLTTPLGPLGGRAVFWIHLDNLDEVVVLLLRYMKEHKTARRITLSRTTSKSSFGSSRGSVSSDRPATDVARMHTVLFDNLETFVGEQNAATVKQAEDAPGSCASRVRLQAIWADDSKSACLCASQLRSSSLSDPTAYPTRRYNSLSMKRKDLVTALSNQEGASENEAQKNDIGHVRKWVKEHPDVEPLARISTQRSRFEGLTNDLGSGCWGTLDQSIGMSSIGDLSSALGDSENTSASSFPHAVLDLRWEQGVPEIFRVLSTSHLVERVRGFSVQVHAVFTVCKLPETAQPLWMQLLSKDIRKLPPSQSRLSSKQTSEMGTVKSTSTSISAPSTDEASTSGTRGLAGQSSATSLLNSAVESNTSSQEEKKLKIAVPHRQRSSSPKQRYWNEFDDGSEADEDQAYTIFVDPDASYDFPGKALVSRGVLAVSSVAQYGVQKLAHMFGSDQHEKEADRQPLLSDNTRHASYTNDPEESSDSASPVIEARPTFSQRQGKAKSRRAINTRRSSRETGLLRTYIGSFVVAYALLIVTAILQATARRKDHLEAGAGIVVGVISSLCLGIFGLSMMLARRERLTWLHRIAVFLAFGTICVASGMILAVMDVSL